MLNAHNQPKNKVLLCYTHQLMGTRLLLASCSVRVTVVLVDILAHIKAPVTYSVLGVLLADGIRACLSGHKGLAVGTIGC